MKLSVLIYFLFVFVYSALLFAQEQDEEIFPPQRSADAKLGGAGGFTTSLLFFDVGPINEILRKANAAELKSGRLLLMGGQGYGYIMFIENFRVGGMGMTGTLETKLPSGTTTSRDVELTIGYGGVTLDYVVQLVSRLDLALGVLLGGGGLDFKITRDYGRNKHWDSLWTEYGTNDPVSEYSRKISGSFFIYKPSINLEYTVLRWFGIRVGVSYLGMTAGKWELDDKYDIFNVPSSIHSKGWMFNGGVFLGTFVF